MRIPAMRVLVAARTLVSMGVTPLSAAELHVYSGGAPQETLKLLAPEFEKATNRSVAFTFAVVGAIQQRLEAGEKADVVLLPVPLISALEAAGKIRPGSRSLLARVGIAVVVRAEAPKPDISSPESLRATLLQARSITHADPQATPGGRHIAALLKQWDITDTPQRRITPKSAISGGAGADRQRRRGHRALSAERGAYSQRCGRGRNAAARIAELHRLCRRGAGRQRLARRGPGVHQVPGRSVEAGAMADNRIREHR